MPQTTIEDVRNLCKSIVTRMENQKTIEFAARLREIIRDEVFRLIEKDIYTDEHLHKKTVETMGASLEELEATDLSQNAQYRTARSMVRKSFGDDELNGFYFQISLKQIATKIAAYMMKSSHIDEVYEFDDDLEQIIVDLIKKFNPQNQH